MVGSDLDHKIKKAAGKLVRFIQLLHFFFFFQRKMKRSGKILASALSSECGALKNFAYNKTIFEVRSEVFLSR